MPRKTLPPEQLAAKKALALTVIDRLRTEYPDAACTLARQYPLPQHISAGAFQAIRR